MNDVMNKMEELLNTTDIITIREGCACKPNKFNKVIKDIKSNTVDTNERLKKLEDAKIAGKVISINDNLLKIVFLTDKCYCGMVGSSKTLIPLSWCHCCKGYIKWVYEKVLEKSVTVQLISSVISGSDDCVFVLEL